MNKFFTEVKKPKNDSSFNVNTK